jgi:predicted transcriptional regulator
MKLETRDNIKHLGVLLKKRRQKYNISISRIYRSSGLCRNSIANLENGNTGSALTTYIRYIMALNQIIELKKMKLKKHIEPFVLFNSTFIFAESDEKICF